MLREDKKNELKSTRGKKVQKIHFFSYALRTINPSFCPKVFNYNFKAVKEKLEKKEDFQNEKNIKNCFSNDSSIIFHEM